MRNSHPVPATAAITVALVALLAFSPACALNMNKSKSVDAGETSAGESTVNGNISVGADAVVDGSLETVNGGIRVDSNARVREVETVNGTIRLAAGVSAADVTGVNGAIDLGDRVTIEGEVAVVNGRIGIGPGSRVANDVSNVNGSIDIDGTEIGGNLKTVNGDVDLRGDTEVRGNLIVEKPNDRLWNRSDRRPPRIVVGPGVRILGNIELEREVELYISDSAQVGGVSGVMGIDEAVRFSGDRP